MRAEFRLFVSVTPEGDPSRGAFAGQMTMYCETEAEARAIMAAIDENAQGQKYYSLTREREIFAGMASAPPAAAT